MGTPKENCRVFTPQRIVIRMLDILRYKENVFGRRILENSCGDGRFLVEIVKRYITDCRKKGYSDQKIKAGLARDICAYEKDKKTYKECIEKLNRLIKKYKISDVKWSIFNKDALRDKQIGEFSFVIGNPPYITYSALSPKNREYIRKMFSVCKDGKPDYYYAFIESAIKSLNANGRMVYLLPSNFFKTRFAQKVRSYMLPALTDVYDYKDKRVFESAMTASAVVVCDKGNKTDKVVYHDVASKKSQVVDKETLKARWLFCPISSNEISKKQVKFGDCYSASSSIATLCNAAFVLEENDQELLKIEQEVIRKAVTPKSQAAKRVNRIIFPYYFSEEGSLQRYSEEEFSCRFPSAVAHLKKYKAALDARNSDKNATWFEYGRSQAISHMNQPKLLLSTVITGKVKVSLLDAETIPYSGIYITADNDSELLDAKRILESRKFYNYAMMVGVRANGKSFRISINDINNYLI